MEKLKPCPFCGGEARLIIKYNQYLVICDGDLWCDAKQGWFSNKSNAISAWNRRANDVCITPNSESGRTEQ